MSTTAASSWTRATDTCMEKLCAATSAEEGKSAFRYELPHSINVFALHIGGGEENGTLFCGLSQIEMGGRIEGRFADPASAQEFAMLALDALPVNNEGNVLKFMARSIPEITAEVWTSPLDGKQHRVFMLRFNVSCLFNTLA